MNTPLWFSNLVFWTAQVALLVVAAGFLPRLFQILQPRVRLVYWRALLAIALALPFLQPWHHAQSTAAFVLAPDLSGATAGPASDPTISHWHFPDLQQIVRILAVVILVGIAARFVILVLGILRLRQFREASSPVPLSSESFSVLEEMRARISPRSEFRFSADVDSPVTFGFAAPVILLPERFLSMDSRFQAAIACHELLHVRRGDWAHHLAEEIVRAGFWFHPAIAWLIARVRLAREQVVDLEVVRLTQARKPYLEALMEFTAGRSRIAAIPAPPFLAERQLAERVALMLKEVRMSRTRLIASLTAIACCLVLAIALAAKTFPLKGAPLAAQSAPGSGIAQGVSSGVSGGVAQGTSGGISTGSSGGIKGGASGVVSGSTSGGVSGDVGQASQDGLPVVGRDTIWTDTVKKGPMVRQVRGLGTLVPGRDPANLIARITLPEVMTQEVRVDQHATVETQKGRIGNGHVIRISPSPSNDTRTVEIALDSISPEGFTVPLEVVDASIDIEKLDDIVYVGRPVHGTANSSVSLFKLVNDGREAVRVNVKFGRSSVNTIEILDGLKVGDKIILSDMSNWDNVDRIQIK